MCYAEWCLTLCDLEDCSLSGSSVHEVFQVRILERIAISFSRGSSRARDGTRVSSIGRRILYHCASKREEGSLKHQSLERVTARCL